MKKLLQISLLAVAGLSWGQEIPSAVIADPPADKANPAQMLPVDVPSHGAALHSVFYLASGAGAHPTVLLLHGFPGNEKNLDLAYSIRRAGWNVLIPHYRGSWGSPGTFSFAHAIEDTDAAIDFLRTQENISRYRIDPARIVVIGHSMGGFLAAEGAAHQPAIAAMAIIAAWNIGPSAARRTTAVPQNFKDSSLRLAGSTPEGLAGEAAAHTTDWNYVNLAEDLKSRPVLVVECTDGNRADNQAMAEALRKAGNTQVTEAYIDSDHVFSDHRIALQAAVVAWLQKLVSPVEKK